MTNEEKREALKRALNTAKENQETIDFVREDARKEFYQALVDHDEKRILKWSQVLHEATIWSVQNQVILDILGGAGNG